MKLLRLALVLAFGSSLFAASKAEVVKRLDASADVFNEIMATPDKGIPVELLERAHCIVIVPNLKKGGFIVGAKYGKGFITCKTGTAWSAPSAIRIEGGSIGAQIGAGEVDVVLVVMNEKGAEKLMKSEFTLGAEAGVMAGPVGRTTTAETDALMRAEMLSYSRSRGVFAGATLGGGTLRSDDEDNTALYGHPVEHRAVLMGKVAKPAAAAPLYTALHKYAVTSPGTKGERARKATP